MAGFLSKMTEKLDESKVKTYNDLVLSLAFFFMYCAFFTMGNIQVYKNLRIVFDIFADNNSDSSYLTRLSSWTMRKIQIPPGT